jgi:hypothetical protein
VLTTPSTATAFALPEVCISPHRFLLSTFPPHRCPKLMFRNGTGFQIYGGSFYDVQSGDVNLHTHQHLTIQDRTLREVISQASLPCPPTLTVVDDSADGYGCKLSGAVRNTRHTVGRAPYGVFDFLSAFLLLITVDMASRRHISISRPPSDHEDHPVPLASHSNAIISSSPHRPSSDPSSEHQFRTPMGRKGGQ